MNIITRVAEFNLDCFINSKQYFLVLFFIWFTANSTDSRSQLNKSHKQFMNKLSIIWALFRYKFTSNTDFTYCIFFLNYFIKCHPFYLKIWWITICYLRFFSVNSNYHRVVNHRWQLYFFHYSLIKNLLTLWSFSLAVIFFSLHYRKIYMDKIKKDSNVFI